jgi:hypothetical protein
VNVKQPWYQERRTKAEREYAKEICHDLTTLLKPAFCKGNAKIRGRGERSTKQRIQCFNQRRCKNRNMCEECRHPTYKNGTSGPLRKAGGPAHGAYLAKETETKARSLGSGVVHLRGRKRGRRCAFARRVSPPKRGCRQGRVRCVRCTARLRLSPPRGRGHLASGRASAKCLNVRQADRLTCRLYFRGTLPPAAVLRGSS